MNAVDRSAERRPTRNLASNESVGRDSVEPVGNNVLACNFATPDTSVIARRRLLSIRGEPLFYANWDKAIFIHYETDPQELQRCMSVPARFLPRAHVCQPRCIHDALLLSPIATHDFLNVRTYVRHNGEPAIYFMREWLSSRMAAWLGPWSFGLPYRFGRIEYDYEDEDQRRGKVKAEAGSFYFCATLEANDLSICAPGSLDEFLLERYTAFTQFSKRRRFFRIWHEPWQQVRATIQIATDNLIHSTGRWWRDARCTGANYSPGMNVWMGWPHAIKSSGVISSAGEELIL
jgi:uncharacterized protein